MTDHTVWVQRSPGGGFVLRMPALYLVVEDSSLDAGWARLEAEKAALVERHRRVGAEGDLPASSRGAEQSDLRRFLLKTAIVVLAGSVLMAGAAFSFAYAVREPLRKAGAKLGRAAIAQVAEGLRDAADSELTPERQQELRRLVREAAPKLEPYVAELRPLVDAACPDQR